MPTGQATVQAHWCLTLLSPTSLLCDRCCVVQMEEKYGCLRMVVLWLFSSLGGTPAPFFTASLSDSSGLCIGAAFVHHVPLSLLLG